MKVLIAASEAAPLIKMGGLGDVIGSLPKALEKQGVNADVVIPFYPKIDASKYKISKNLDLEVPFAGESHLVEVYKSKLPGSNVDAFMLNNHKFFRSGGMKAFADTVSETEMFTFFGKAVVELIKASFGTYNLIHCNDWHVGLVTQLLRDELGNERPATLFTIHNLLYQGVGDPELIQDVGIAPGTSKILDWDLQDGDVNLMLEGITSSDFVSTVSPSYAREILTPEFGRDFFEILKTREGRLEGILNGIDYSAFPRDFDQTNWQDCKQESKKALKKELGLPDEEDVPLFSFISRLDPGQKGLDILFNVVSKITEKGGQFVLLGTGDPKWEERFKKLSEEKEISDGFSCNIMFDTKLATRIYSASDFILIPSLYEPCGLTQMIGMYYGTIPVARSVGGLKDSIKDNVDGFLFEDYDYRAFAEALNRAFSVYNSRVDMEHMVENALNRDFSWDKSALEYKKLYEKVINCVK